jgi:hypothetical protein
VADIQGKKTFVKILFLMFSSDLYPLQFTLNKNGYRVCTYDYPGTGWSDPGVDIRQPLILDRIVREISEPGPFVILGTMDGGPNRILELSLSSLRPSIQGLVVLDYNPGPSEMEMYRILNNLTLSEALPFAISSIQSRHRLGQIIAAIVVQWGLMGVFAPPSAPVVAGDAQMEKLFLNIYNEKQWQTQILYLAEQLANPPSLFSYDNWSTQNLSQLPPVLWFYNNINITLQECEKQQNTAQQCAQNQLQNEIYLQNVQSIVNTVPGSKLFVTQNAKGFLSEGENIPGTVSNILANI